MVNSLIALMIHTRGRTRGTRTWQARRHGISGLAAYRSLLMPARHKHLDQHQMLADTISKPALLTSRVTRHCPSIRTSQRYGTIIFFSFFHSFRILRFKFPPFHLSIRVGARHKVCKKQFGISDFRSSHSSRTGDWWPTYWAVGSTACMPGAWAPNSPPRPPNSILPVIRCRCREPRTSHLIFNDIHRYPLSITRMRIHL